MTVQTVDNTYIVINELPSEYGRNRFVCIRKSDDKKVFLFKINNRQIILKIMEYVSSCEKNKNFSDFCDYFTMDGCLYMAFEYGEGRTITDVCKEHMSLKERVELLSRIMQLIIIEDMPEFFQYICLDTDNIMVDTTGTISFDYNIKDIENYDKYTIEDVWQNLLKVVNIIFSHELKIHSIEVIDKWVNSISNNRYEQLIDAYKDFNNISPNIKDTSEMVRTMPKTKGFKRWEKIKGSFKFIKRLLVIILIVVSLAYLIFTINTSNKRQHEKNVFDTIGTLKIEEHN